MARPNWFFAFPLDGRFVLELPELPPGFRRYEPEDVHLTLAFLGVCGEAAAQRALHTLDEHLLKLELPAIEVSLGRVEAMGSQRAYSALSALLDRGRSETEARIAALRDALIESANGRREQRRPKAHVTLARPSRRVTEEQRRAGLAWAGALDLRTVHARLDRIALYTWHENRAVQLFQRVAERTLR
jgi:2'-5' RNA ligase